MKKDSVIIHGERLVLKEFERVIDSCRSRTWTKQTWTPKSALVYKSGVVQQYVGQDYDPNEARLDENAWEHDHCEICAWTLNEREERNIGYIDNNENWLCTECYSQFIEE